MSQKNARMGAGRLQDLLQPTGEEELLDVEYPRPRLRVPVWQAAVIAVVVIAAALVWLGMRRAPDFSPTHAVATVSESTGPLVVSVVGEVDNPGLVTVTPGARVAEALASASPRPGANLTDINHAARLEDGQQINVVPIGQAPEGDAPGGDGIRLNTATAADLMTLSGVGEVTAQAIIDYRDSIGGFSSVEQLQDVSGIGPAKFALIAPQVSL
ncbi:ComEA family DNA-binding protein [uncultured Corynebacterium sp.]|uniref:ComEA family DNA-binding protein n=1 Tax=uncultured Corynebacterium sp. TaxID=159447 RepID=UPI0025E95C08|nr:ComEA family DNA-binding protein [uncultured Corynebacterium sp.]